MPVPHPTPTRRPSMSPFFPIWGGALNALLLFLLLPAPVLSQEGVHEQEVRELLNHPGVQRALAAAQELDAGSQEELIALTEIPAPPFMEEERARAYAELLRGAGADSVVVDAVGNILA